MSEAITLLEKVIEQFEPLTGEQEELISQIVDYLESQYEAQENHYENRPRTIPRTSSKPWP